MTCCLRVGPGNDACRVCDYHGVDPHIISDLRDGAMRFFVQDEGTKKLYNHGLYGNPFGGYTGMNSEAVSSLVHATNMVLMEEVDVLITKMMSVAL